MGMLTSASVVVNSCKPARQLLRRDAHGRALCLGRRHRAEYSRSRSTYRRVYFSQIRASLKLRSLPFESFLLSVIERYDRFSPIYDAAVERDETLREVGAERFLYM